MRSCRTGLSGAGDAKALPCHRRITRPSGKPRSPKMAAPSGKDGESGEVTVRGNAVSPARHPHPTAPAIVFPEILRDALYPFFGNTSELQPHFRWCCWHTFGMRRREKSLVSSSVVFTRYARSTTGYLLGCLRHLAMLDGGHLIERELLTLSAVHVAGHASRPFTTFACSTPVRRKSRPWKR